MRSLFLLTAMVLLMATPAQARFGKGGSSGGSSSGGARGGSSGSSGSSGGTHSARPVDSGRSGGSSNNTAGNGGGRYVGPGPNAYGWGYGYGFYSGAFVPFYGYGYRPYGYYGAPTVIVSSGVPAATEPSTLRATAGADFMYFVANVNKGYTLGINGSVEGERWGFNAMAQNIAVAADDGTNVVDNIQQLNAHVSFAFLTGTYGRIRAELGADAVFAPSAVFLGPSIGLSGVLWIVGPLAFESSVYGTVYPFWQLDWKAALVIGAGPVGFRVGWRTQVLDDRGTVDGVIHRDVYMGPYAGIGVAF